MNREKPISNRILAIIISILTLLSIIVVNFEIKPLIKAANEDMHGFEVSYQFTGHPDWVSSWSSGSYESTFSTQLKFSNTSGLERDYGVGELEFYFYYPQDMIKSYSVGNSLSLNGSESSMNEIFEDSDGTYSYYYDKYYKRVVVTNSQELKKGTSIAGYINFNLNLPTVGDKKIDKSNYQKLNLNDLFYYDNNFKVFSEFVCKKDNIDFKTQKLEISRTYNSRINNTSYWTNSGNEHLLYFSFNRTPSNSDYKYTSNWSGGRYNYTNGYVGNYTFSKYYIEFKINNIFDLSKINNKNIDAFEETVDVVDNGDGTKTYCWYDTTGSYSGYANLITSFKGSSSTTQYSYSNLLIIPNIDDYAGKQIESEITLYGVLNEDTDEKLKLATTIPQKQTVNNPEVTNPTLNSDGPGINWGCYSKLKQINKKNPQTNSFEETNSTYEYLDRISSKTNDYIFEYENSVALTIGGQEACALTAPWNFEFLFDKVRYTNDETNTYIELPNDNFSYEYIKEPKYVNNWELYIRYYDEELYADNNGYSEYIKYASSDTAVFDENNILWLPENVKSLKFYGYKIYNDGELYNEPDQYGTGYNYGQMSKVLNDWGTQMTPYPVYLNVGIEYSKNLKDKISFNGQTEVKFEPYTTCKMAWDFSTTHTYLPNREEAFSKLYGTNSNINYFTILYDHRRIEDTDKNYTFTEKEYPSQDEYNENFESLLNSKPRKDYTYICEMEGKEANISGPSVYSEDNLYSKNTNLENINFDNFVKIKSVHSNISAPKVNDNISIYAGLISIDYDKDDQTEVNLITLYNDIYFYEQNTQTYFVYYMNENEFYKFNDNGEPIRVSKDDYYNIEDTYTESEIKEIINKVDVNDKNFLVWDPILKIHYKYLDENKNVVLLIDYLDTQLISSAPEEVYTYQTYNIIFYKQKRAFQYINRNSSTADPIYDWIEKKFATVFYNATYFDLETDNVIGEFYLDSYNRFNFTCDYVWAYESGPYTGYISYSFDRFAPIIDETYRNQKEVKIYLATKYPIKDFQKNHLAISKYFFYNDENVNNYIIDFNNELYGNTFPTFKTNNSVAIRYTTISTDSGYIDNFNLDSETKKNKTYITSTLSIADGKEEDTVTPISYLNNHIYVPDGIYLDYEDFYNSLMINYSNDYRFNHPINYDNSTKSFIFNPNINYDNIQLTFSDGSALEGIEAIEYIREHTKISYKNTTILNYQYGYKKPNSYYPNFPLQEISGKDIIVEYDFSDNPIVFPTQQNNLRAGNGCFSITFPVYIDNNSFVDTSNNYKTITSSTIIDDRNNLIYNYDYRYRTYYKQSDIDAAASNQDPSKDRYVKAYLDYMDINNNGKLNELIAFDTATVYNNLSGAGLQTFTKEIKTSKSNDKFSSEDLGVPQGEEYTYRMLFSTIDNFSSLDLIDYIENYNKDGFSSKWKGTFKSVNTKLMCDFMNKKNNYITGDVTSKVVGDKTNLNYSSIYNTNWKNITLTNQDVINKTLPIKVYYSTSVDSENNILTDNNVVFDKDKAEQLFLKELYFSCVNNYEDGTISSDTYSLLNNYKINSITCTNNVYTSEVTDANQQTYNNFIKNRYDDDCLKPEWKPLIADSDWNWTVPESDNISNSEVKSIAIIFNGSKTKKYGNVNPDGMNFSYNAIQLIYAAGIHKDLTCSDCHRTFSPTDYDYGFGSIPDLYNLNNYFNLFANQLFNDPLNQETSLICPDCGGTISTTELFNSLSSKLTNLKQTDEYVVNYTFQNISDISIAANQTCYYLLNMVAPISDEALNKKTYNSYYVSYSLDTGENSSIFETNRSALTLLANTGLVQAHLMDSYSGLEIPGGSFNLTKSANDSVIKNQKISDGTSSFVSLLGYTEPVQLDYDNYYYLQTEALNKYNISKGKHQFEINMFTQMFNRNQIIDIYNDRTKTDASFIKYDSMDYEKGVLTPVEGARYEIYCNEEDNILTPKDTKVAEGITDKNGVLKTNLPWGKYYIKETFSPPAYILDPEIHEFEITPEDCENGVYSLNLQETRKLGSFVFTLTGADGYLPSGAEYDLYIEENGEYIPYITNEFVTAVGVFSYNNLPWAKYYLIETKAPQGYLINNDPVYFEVNKDNCVSDIYLYSVNECLPGSITLTKTYEKDSDVKVQNAVYRIYDYSNNLVPVIYDEETSTYKYSIESNTYDCITDTNGQFTVTNLPWGTYYALEEKAPFKYALNQNKIAFKINRYNSNDGAMIETTDEEATASIRVTKKIKANEVCWDLEDPTFTYKIEGTTDNQETVTYYMNIQFTKDMSPDANGYLTAIETFSDMPHGTYTLTEEEVIRYEIGGITEVSNNSTLRINPNNSISFQLESKEDTNENLFVNVEIVNDRLYKDGESSVRNQVNYISGKKNIVGIMASTKKISYLPSDLITLNDINVSVLYEDGTIEPITSIDENKYTLKWEDQQFTEAGDYLEPITAKINGIDYETLVPVTISEWLFYTREDGTLSVFGYIGLNNEATIPSMIGSKTVTQIGYGYPNEANKIKEQYGTLSFENSQGQTYTLNTYNGASNYFIGIEKIKSLTLPNTIKSITGNYLFYISNNNYVGFAQNLEKVIITSNAHLTDILPNSFYIYDYRPGLFTLELQDNVVIDNFCSGAIYNSNAQNINYYYQNNKDLINCNYKRNTIKFGNNSYIKNYLGNSTSYFKDTTAYLKEKYNYTNSISASSPFLNNDDIHLEGTEYIGEYALQNSCFNSLNTGNQLEEIANNGFYSSAGKQLTLGYSIKYMGTYVFQNSKIPYIQLPGSSIYLGSYAFYNSSVEKIDFDANNKAPEDIGGFSHTVGNYIFSSANKLKEVKFPDGYIYFGSPSYQINTYDHDIDIELPDTIKYLYINGNYNNTHNIKFRGNPQLLYLGTGNETVKFPDTMDYSNLKYAKSYVPVKAAESAEYEYYPYIKYGLNPHIIIGENKKYYLDLGPLSNRYNYNNIQEKSKTISVDYSSPELITGLNGDNDYSLNNMSEFASLNVNINNNVNKIPYYMFSSNSTIPSSDINIPSSVNIIEDYAFENIAVPNIILNEGIEYIGNKAFYSTYQSNQFNINYNLKSVAIESITQNKMNLPDSLIYIGSNVFGASNYITSIHFGKNLKYLASDFIDISTYPKLKSLTIDPENKYLKVSDDGKTVTDIEGKTVVFSIDPNVKVGSVNNESLEYVIQDGELLYINNYELAQLTSEGNLILEIPEGVTKISSGAFSRIKDKDFEVIAPTSLVEIEPFAFYNSSINKFVGNTNLAKIGDYAFAISKISYVDWNNAKLNVLPKYCFAFTTDLTYIDIPHTVEKIDVACFLNANKLKEVNFEENSQVKELAAASFYETTGNTNGIKINLPHSIEKIDTYALYNSFINYSQLGALNKLTYIGDFALSYNNGTYADKFKSNSIAIIPENVKYVGYKALGYNDTNNYNNPSNRICSLIIKSPDVKFESSPVDYIFYEDNKYYFYASNLEYNVYIPENLNSEALKMLKETGFYINVMDMDSQTEAFEYKVLSDNSIEITGVKEGIYKYISNDCILNIPETYDGYTISSIGDNAFSSSLIYMSINSMSLPSTINHIGHKVFEPACENKQKLVATSSINELTINSSELTIEEDSFDTIDSLDNLSLPNLQVIPDNIFAKTNIKNLKLSSNLIKVGDNCFKTCQTVESIIPSSCTYIGNNAFGLSSFAIEFTDITTVTHLGDKALYNANITSSQIKSGYSFSNIKEYGKQSFPSTIEQIVITKGTELPDEFLSGYRYLKDFTYAGPGLEKIGTSAFRDCSLLRNLVLGGSNDTYTEIPDYCFYGCGELRSITFTKFNTITKYGDYAFYNCKWYGYGQSQYPLPTSLKHIGSHCFYGNFFMYNIDLSGVEYIGEKVFENCTHIESINYPDNCTIYGAQLTSNIKTFSFGNNNIIDGSYFINNRKDLVEMDFSNVDFASTASYVLSGGDNIRTVVLDPNTTLIPSYFASNLKNLTSVNFANLTNLESIEYNAFSGASSLNNINLSNCVELKEIKGNAFSNINNASFSTLDLSQNTNITNIGYNAFSNNTYLTSIKLPTNIETIGNSAFSNNSITEISIPNTLKTLDSQVFANTKITTLTLPDDLTITGSIGPISTLTSIVFGKDTKVTNASLLINLPLLETVDLSNVEFLTDSSTQQVFSGDIALKTVILPNNLTTIGGAMFNQCSNLENITIPNSVTKIEQQAFANCAKLKTVTLPSELNSFGENASSFTYSPFYNCSQLEQLIFTNTKAPKFGKYSLVNIPTTIKLKVPTGTIEDYKNATKLIFATSDGTKLFNSVYEFTE